MSDRQTRAIRDHAVMRERLRLALGAEWPRGVMAVTEHGKITLSRAHRSDRIPGIWIEGHGPAALVVHPDGAEAARSSEQVRKLTAAGRAVLLIDAFQTGSAKVARDRSHKFFLTFNLTDDASRVQDILTALAYLGSKMHGEVELIGLDRAAVWAVFAAALAPDNVKLSSDTSAFSGTDQAFLDRFFVPGIQRAGGWQAALELARGTR